jgi:hypothetical protein
LKLNQKFNEEILKVNKELSAQSKEINLTWPEFKQEYIEIGM